MTYRQESPFAVQIELAEGCNLYCSFCGLRGIRNKPGTNYKFMELHTLRVIMDSITKAGWNPRIEFAMHGEPTMHPDYHKMIRVARKYAPQLQLMMTTNGGGLLRDPGAAENVKELFKSGLHVLALDDYNGVKIVEKIVERMGVSKDFMDYLDDENIMLYNYPDEPKGNPHTRRKPNERLISIIEDIGSIQRGKGTHSHLNNHAGAGAPLNKRGVGKRCAKPFREMSFRWDGSVAVCCNDWRGVYKCGNILHSTLLEIWHGPELNAARHKLYHGMRDFGPCKGCDAMSHRVGLLPDKLGKVKLSEPTQRHLDVIATALEGKPYTAPVLRPWEKRK